MDDDQHTLPELVFSKALCDLGLALYELHEIKEQLTKDPVEGSFFNKVKDDTIEGKKWRWEVKYPEKMFKFMGCLSRLGILPPLRPAKSNNKDDQGESRPSNPSTPAPLAPHTDDPRTEIRPLCDGNIAPGPKVTNEGIHKHDDIESGRQNVAQDFNVLEFNRNGQQSITISEDQVSEQLDEGSLEAYLVRQEESKAAIWPDVQIWTLTHSHYAQMGGIIYKASISDEQNYLSLTPSQLTPRYLWHGEESPLQYLVLGEKDIKDKSKADALVKGIAILQIAWLLLSVITRYVTGLPITQLEIATIAFAIMAIAIYLASFWKPKDVSQPTILNAELSSGSARKGCHDRVQPLWLRLRSPAKAEKGAMKIGGLERVQNDLMWMEGNTPPIFTLMAMSSLIFGGLHCLAWNFEFPSMIERTCWRVASLVSAILPVLVVAVSLVISYFSNTVIESRLISIMVRKLVHLDTYSLDWWRVLIDEVSYNRWSRSVDEKWRLARSQSLADSREEVPSESDVETTLKTMQHIIRRLQSPVLYRDPGALRDAISKARPGAMRDDLTWEMRNLVPKVEGINSSRIQCKIWREYEEYVSGRSKVADGKVPPARSDETTCLKRTLAAWEELEGRDIPWAERWQEKFRIVSSVLTTCSFIVYGIARLLILVLLFTCLRSTPAGTYQATPWVRFLPSFS